MTEPLYIVRVTGDISTLKDLFKAWHLRIDHVRHQWYAWDVPYDKMKDLQRICMAAGLKYEVEIAESVTNNKTGRPDLAQKTLMSFQEVEVEVDG